MYDICNKIFHAECKLYPNTEGAAYKKSTTALMDRDNAEMFTVLFFIYKLNNHSS